MKKITIGLIAGIIIATASVSFGYLKEVSGMVNVGGFNLPEYQRSDVTKMYDQDNKVVCYIYSDYNRAGISCLKND